MRENKYQEQKLKGKNSTSRKESKIILDNKKFAVRWLEPVCWFIKVTCSNYFSMLKKISIRQYQLTSHQQLTLNNNKLYQTQISMWFSLSWFSTMPSQGSGGSNIDIRAQMCGI